MVGTGERLTSLPVIGRINNNSVLARAAGRLAPGRVVTLSGVWGSAAPLLAALLARIKGWPLLYVCSHLDAADDAADDMELLTGAGVSLFPAWEADAHSDHVSDEIAAQRLHLCASLSQASGLGAGPPPNSFASLASSSPNQRSTSTPAPSTTNVAGSS